ncbi:unnamed protein product, partial [Rotaria magnacalcarata]
YNVYCPNSIRYWTIKSSAKIDILLIPEEFRQFCPISGTIGYFDEIPLEIEHCRNSDVEIPVSKFLC